MKNALFLTVCCLLMASCNKGDDGDNVCYLATPYVFARGGARFILPTAFTPNADGRNDLFRPIGVTGLTNFSMTVYDNSGNAVFRTTDPYTTGWDGRSNSGSGTQMPEGKYVVSFQFSTVNGDAETRQVCLALLAYGPGNCIPQNGIDTYYFEDQIDRSTGDTPYSTSENFCP